jgi:hypothetical protein
MIESAVAKAPDVESLEDDPFLNAFFLQLTKTNEARRCINYLFKQKCERIDLSFLTMKNMQKIYLKYAEQHENELEELKASIKEKSVFKQIGNFFRKKDDKDDDSRPSTSSRATDTDSRGTEIKNATLTSKQLKFLKSMFSSLMDIADAIMS